MVCDGWLRQAAWRHAPGDRRNPMTQPRSTARTRSPRARRAWQAAAVMTTGALTVLGVAAGPAGASPPSGHPSGYRQINMVADRAGFAPLTDPDLVNAWGLSASPGTNQAPGSPLWVSDNGTDKTTLYAGATATTVVKVPTFPTASMSPRAPRPARYSIPRRAVSSCKTRTATRAARPSSSTRRTVGSTAGTPLSEPLVPGHRP